MKVIILQRDIEWCDSAINLQRASEAIDRTPGADLYVLPEMFSTGFCTVPVLRISLWCRGEWYPICPSGVRRWASRRSLEWKTFSPVTSYLSVPMPKASPSIPSCWPQTTTVTQPCAMTTAPTIVSCPPSPPPSR